MLRESGEITAVTRRAGELLLPPFFYSVELIRMRDDSFTDLFICGIITCRTATIDKRESVTVHIMQLCTLHHGGFS